jgi:amino acid adenylation domain-containing protein
MSEHKLDVILSADDVLRLLEFLGENPDPDPMSGDHLVEDEFASYSRGGCAPEEGEHIDEHLAICEECTVRMEEWLMDVNPVQRSRDTFAEVVPTLASIREQDSVFEWNDTYPRDACVHELVAAWAERTPDALALVWRERAVTYRELDDQAGRLARALRARGVGPDAVVAVVMERSIELVVTLLAVLKAGGAFAPLDPSAPPERRAGLLRLLGEAGRVISLETGWEEQERREDLPAGPALPQPSADNLAYVMFTSGTTGQPKGVAVPHRAVVRLVRGADYARLDAGETFLLLAPVSFDASTLEIWGALANGARLVIYPEDRPAFEELGEAIAGYGVTTLWLTAGLFHQMVESHVAGLGGVRQLLAGGDVLSPRHVRVALAALPGCTVINGYGPTENTTFTCCHPMAEAAAVGETVPIGRPIAGTRVVVVDEDLIPAPAGASGELLAGGDGLARGYLGRPDLTAERFIPDPAAGLAGEPGARVYRTGDLVSALPDGTLLFLGRIDQQVKIRGFRIEPAEIEAALAAHPAVAAAAVMPLQGKSGLAADRRLAAFVVARPGEAPPAAEELRGFLRERLPEPMIPAAWAFPAAFPLTANGKVDRRALARLDVVAAGTGESRETAASRTQVEEELAAIWEDLLGISPIGVDDDFFALGGHSLLATQMLSRVRRAFRVDLAPQAVFDAPTVAGLARVVADARGTDLPEITAGLRPERLPLSNAQQRLWFLDRLIPRLHAYNLPYAFRLRGPFDAAALERALGEVVRRHEALRTVFAADDDGPYQVIRPAEDFHVRSVDLPFAAALALAGEEARRPFDLAADLPLRATLVRLGEVDHVLVLVVHHIASDAWSQDLLWRELSALYRSFAAGEPSPLPELPVQYADFALWQAGRPFQEAMAPQLAWWTERLAGAPEILDLPADRPRPAVQSFRGGCVEMELGGGEARAVRGFARRQGITPFMTLLAAFGVLLHRRSGQEDLVVGSPIAGRNRTEIEGLIGFFVNTLALRLDLGGDPSFAALADRVGAATLEAYAHQDLPFERLVEELRPERHLSHAPLFQVALAFAAAAADLDLPGLAAEPLRLATGTAKFDLALSVTDRKDALTLALEHAADLFDGATAARLIEHFRTLLLAAVGEPERRISELALLTPAERHELLAEWNDTGRVFNRMDGGGLVHEAVSWQARRRPDALAVAAGARRLSYGELEARSNRLSHHLRSLGVGLESRVAIFMERTPERVVAVLAVLKAGGAYVSLDTAHPRERLAFQIADAGSPVVLTQEDLAALLPAVSIPVLSPDDDWPGIAGREDAPPESGPAHRITPQSLAYVIYTSGSTGTPKGVEIPHAGLANLVAWHRDLYGVEPGDRATLVANPAFDASVWEVWPYLTAGASLHIPEEAVRLAPKALAEWSAREGITLSFLPTPLAEAMLDEDLPPGLALRALLVGGDRLHRGPVPGAGFRLMNHYGPSESSVVATMEPLEAVAPLEAVPAIGRPIANTRVYAVDPNGEPVPVGVPGELCVAGAGLARGYLGRPDLTAERFVPDPFSPLPGERMYRTGDLVRRRLTGSLDFLGRLDHQVKVRGLRIELGEIEAVLGRHPAVREAAVLLREGRLVAYLAGEETAADELPEYLGQRLPEYMVPAVLVWLPSLPLSANGKLDRRALAALPPLGPDAAREEDETGRTPLEETLAAIWAELLGVPRIGVHDDFFALGGHSLLATRVLSRVRRACGVELMPRALFEAPTVAELARLVETARGAAPAPVPQPEAPPAPKTPPVSAACLHQLFIDQALRAPEAVALIGPDGGSLTYRELDAASSSLARRLRASGVGPEVLAGVLLERSTELLVALLAVLKAGGAYVPIDPAYPRRRVAFLLENSGAAVLLTRRSLLAGFAASLPAAAVPVFLDEGFAAGPDAHAPAPESANLAYVIYTSGSTGTPKGVALEHRSAVAFVRWALAAFPAADLAGVLAATSVCFDLSIFEIFVPLAAGGTVILAQNALALPDHPAAGAVTLVNTVPSAMAELVRSGGVPASVRTVNLAGEPLKGSLVRSLYERTAAERVYNLYGPSEDTTYSTFTLVPRGAETPAIGRPLPGTRVHLLDAGLSPVPPGEPGEIHLAGGGLARGYLGRPELTAERFIPDPFGAPGSRLYRTGDLARLKADGELEFLGRADRQVKVRGFRIELGEIETALERQESVRECAVLALPEPDGEGSRLVAFVVPAGGAAADAERELAASLRAALRESLPEPLVPTGFVVLPALPLTPNAKLDRRALERAALPAAVTGAAPEADGAPRTPVERVIAGIWTELFARPVGIHESFFDLGGHSLLGVRVMSRLRSALGVDLSVRSLFTAPTVAALAAHVEVARSSREGTVSLAATPSPPEGGRAASVVPLSFAQSRLWFLDQLAPGSAVYNIPFPLRLCGALDAAVLAGALSAVVERHAVLRTTFADVEGEPYQVVAAPRPVPLPVVDLAGLNRGEARRLFAAESRRPFDLAAGPLLRATLLRLAADEHWLLLTVHHIVADGWSMEILTRELAALYAAFAAGAPSPLADLPMQYADFAVWQRRWLTAERRAVQLEHWRRELAGAPACLDLPTDHPRPPVQTYRGANVTRSLPPAVAAGVRSLCRRERVTPFMMSLAALDTLLMRYSRQEDILVGGAVAGRNRAETEELIGFFVNTLVLRADLAGDPPFLSLLRQVGNTALAAYAHQDLPFEILVEELRPGRDLSRSPFFQVLLNLHQGLAPRIPFAADLTAEPMTVETGTAKFDLNVTVTEAGETLELDVEYATDLWTAATADRLLTHLSRLFAAAVERPDLPLSDLPLLSAEEEAQSLGEHSARAYILDAALRPVPPGVPGEVHLAGDGLACGFLGRPELTAARFLPDPYGAPGSRLYRTGDLARRRAGGAIELLGRIDPEARELTPGSKPARREQAAPQAADGGGAPRTPLEGALAGIWAEIFARPVGIHDNFFDLGGHSLLAARALSRVRTLLDVEIPLRSLFSAPTVARLAEQIEAARGTGAPAPALSLTPREGRGLPGGLPLSFAQGRLWFLDQLAPGSAAYNLPFPLRLSGTLAPAVLARALSEVVRRHEALRTTFAEVAGEPRQIIAAPQPVPLPLVDLSGLAPAGGTTCHAEARRLLREEIGRPFDLVTGPLLRTPLLRLGAEEHWLLLTVHHIVTDGWSMEILSRELGTLYGAFAAGSPSPLPDLPMQYADYALWQRRWLAGETLASQLDFWRRKLAGAPAALDLPTDHPRPAVRSFLGAAVVSDLPPDLTADLRRLGQERRSTLFMVLLAGFQTLLHRSTGQDDLLVGSPIAGRGRSESEGLIGFFVNTLVLRGDLSPGPAGAPTFDELLARTSKVTLEAYAHQDLPFDVLVEELRPERSLALTPLFQVVLALQNTPVADLELPGVRVSTLPVEVTTAKFDLTLSAGEQQGGLTIEWEHATDLFEPATIERLAACFRTLLLAAVRQPERRLSELPLLTPAERHELLVAWNDTGRDFVQGRRVSLVHEQVAEQARRRPDAPAVVAGLRRLSYGELEARSNRLAHHLRALGVGPESRVAVLMERTPERVVAILAVLKAGGASVSLDPSHPRERLAFQIADAGSPVVLTQGGLAARLPGVSIPVLSLDDTWRGIAGREDVPPESAVGPQNLAYVIYTSGSTGTPKGVEIPHAGLANLADWHRERYGVEPGDRATLVASPAFDAAVWEVWPYLTAGASLHIPKEEVRLAPEALAAWYAREGITLSFLPTPLAEILLEHLETNGNAVPAPGLALRALLVGGDRLHRGPVSGAHFRLMNHYGPSESSVVATVEPVDRQERAGGMPLIGRPIANTRVYVLDGNGEPAPVGVPGELCVAGTGLARGYLGRPDLTAEKLVPDPFSASPGERMYRTGDLVRWRPTGRLDFLGRLDHQVKVRGLRIELGEIEAELDRHPAVREAAVLLREGRLVAYLAGEETPADELRESLAERLPEHMVPAVLVHLPSLPRSANGKTDRRALAALPPPEPETDREGSEGPRTPEEEMLTGLFSEVLGLGAAAGIHDSFFHLGGHSLLAIRLVSRVRQSFGVELAVRDLFEKPTVAGLAGILSNLSRRAAPAPERAEHTGFPPLSFAQSRLWFLDQLSPGSAVYNIPFPLCLRGRLDPAVLARALSEVVRRHEALRTTFAAPQGEAHQVIHPARPVPLPLVDLGFTGRAATAEAAAEARRLLQEDSRRPFDLAAGPLLRTALLRLSEEEHWLLLAVHHIVTDGWSMEILIRELATLYGAFAAGLPSPLAELPMQYADFAVWQRRQLTGETLETQLEYWRRQLAGAPGMLDLPTDQPRPAVQTWRGATLARTVPPPVAAGLRALCRREKATLFMTVLAALNVLLARYCRQDDLTVGFAVAGRSSEDTEGLIGFFVNALVLRADLAGDPPFRTLLHQVRETALNAYAHQDLPFEVLVERLRPERDLSRSPFFQVLLNVNTAAPFPAFGRELTAGSLPMETGTAKFDLNISVIDAGSFLEVAIEYATDLFTAPTMARLLGHLFRLMAAAEQPERAVADLPLLTAGEEQQILVDWNDTATLPASAVCLHHLVADQARRTPAATALIAPDGRRLTYRELDERSAALAGHLRALGVGPEALAGVMLDRDIELVVALLAVLRAGGAYVPIDPAYPRQRVAFLLENSGAAVLLTRRALLAGFAASLPAAVPVFLDEGFTAVPGANLPAPDSGNLAYIIYTSGSTGIPKGVALEHRSAVAFVRWAQGVFSREDLAGVLAATSVCFDLSIFEIFVPLASGGTVMLAENALALPSHPAAGEVTLVNTVPSAMAELVRSAGVPGSVRTVNLAGEALKGALVRSLYEQTAAERVYNLYGPSEDTTYSTFALIPRDAGTPSIGRPVAGTRAYVLDDSLRPVPAGVPGAVYLAGDGLARGYLGRPELTAERFLPAPYGPPGSRLYRTGDLARFRADGELEFLGRIDHQVKVRGFRIELGEIEAALARLESVRESAVLALPEPTGEGSRLVAFVVPEGETPPEAERDLAAALRAALKEGLPAPLVPTAFAFLSALPLTPNGKLDRRALEQAAPQSVGGGPVAEEGGAPRTPVEEVLDGIWADVFARPVGIHENFFDLGGHSILAVRVISRIRAALDVDLPLSRLFAAPTVASLAVAVEEEIAERRGVPLPPLGPALRGGELPLSFAQQRLWLLDALDPGNPVFNLPSPVRLTGPLDAGVLECALTEIVRRHESLRTVFQGREGHPVQIVRPAGRVPLPLADLSGLPASRREDEALLLADREGRLPFDLARGPLVRTSLLRLSAADHVLSVTMHHIVTDGWSINVFVRELQALYAAFAAGRPSPLPELALQYPDFALWQRRALDGDALAALLGRFTQRFGTDLPVLRLPTDRSRPPVQTNRGSIRSLQLPKELSEETRRLAQRSGATLFMTLLAAFQALLARYTGQEKIVVGTPVAGRNHAAIEGLIGFFVNTVVLPADAAGDPTFAQLLDRVRDMALAAYACQDLPFEKLVEALQPERDRSRSPLFQVMFSLQNDAGAVPGVDGAAFAIEPVEGHTGTSQFDLTLFAADMPGGFWTAIEYNTDLFAPATIERMLLHYRALLTAAMAAPDTRLSALPPAQDELPRPAAEPAVAQAPDGRRDRLAARMSKLTPAQREALEKRVRGGR